MGFFNLVLEKTEEREKEELILFFAVASIHQAGQWSSAGGLAAEM